jgi:DNA-binding transcriptional LysR family regulator
MQQVRYFVALCDTLNFTRAAERCNVTQPSLTRAIKLLEDELGGPLFHRERNRTHLSELGRQVEPHLRAAASDSEEARRRARDFVRLQAPVLRVGVVRRLPLTPFVGLFHRFARAHPDAELAMQSAEPAELLDALRRGEQEVVIVPHMTAAPDDLHYYPITHDRPQVVLPEGHPSADLAALTADDLAGAAIVCLDGCDYWAGIERALRERGESARPQVVVDKVSWLFDVVRAGLGIGVVSGHQVPGPGLVGRPLLEPPLETSVMLATKRGRLYSPPVRAFVEIALAPRRSASPHGAA